MAATRSTVRRISSAASTSSPGAAFTPADVHHVRALGDHLVDPLQGRGHGVGGPAVVERVGCPVHDRHQHERAVWDVQGTDPEQPVPPSADAGVVESANQTDAKGNSRWRRRTVDGVEGVQGLVGQHLGYSDWVEVTQEQVNQFAEATGDHQWIHVDPERAKKESPFGGPIAHGYLTLSLIPSLLPQIVEIAGFRMGVNYGTEKVRFPSPVPVGSRVRAGATLESATPFDGGVAHEHRGHRRDRGRQQAGDGRDRRLPPLPLKAGRLRGVRAGRRPSAPLRAAPRRRAGPG